MIQRAVCTGGAGFVGSHVVEELLRRGCEHILVLDDLSTGRVENLVELNVDLELNDAASLTAAKAIEQWKPEVVYHLAAQTDVQASIRDPRHDAATNILATLRVLDAASRCGARVVFASTGGAMYGDCVEPATEETPAEPRSPYAVSKLAGEWYVRQHQGVVLRYGNVYGPRQLASVEGGVVAIFTDALERGTRATIFGDGLQTRDFVHVEDVARATVDGAFLPSEVFNVGTGVETRIIDLAAEIGAKCDFAPERPGEVRRSVLDSTQLRAAQCWTPRLLSEGLASMRECLVV